LEVETKLLQQQAGLLFGPPCIHRKRSAPHSFCQTHPAKRPHEKRCLPDANTPTNNSAIIT